MFAQRRVLQNLLSASQGLAPALLRLEASVLRPPGLGSVRLNWMVPSVLSEAWGNQGPPLEVNFIQASGWLNSFLSLCFTSPHSSKALSITDALALCTPRQPPQDPKNLGNHLSPSHLTSELAAFLHLSVPFLPTEHEHGEKVTPAICARPHPVAGEVARVLVGLLLGRVLAGLTGRLCILVICKAQDNSRI